MTVRELKEALNEFNEDLEILGFDYFEEELRLIHLYETTDGDLVIRLEKTDE